MSTSFRMLGVAPAWAASLLLAGLSACGFDIPLKEPAPVVQQAQHSAEVRPGESTRESVRVALGQPVLHSRYWGFDLFRATGTAKDLGMNLITIWPVPMGVLLTSVEGFALVTYDATGLVTKVSTGSYETDLLHFQMLNAGDLHLAFDRRDGPRPVLMADAHRIQDYLASRVASETCTVVIACDETGPADAPYEACPERVTFDGKAFNPRPSTGFCEPGNTCPAGAAIERKDLRRIPLVLPITLQPGRHQVVMSREGLQGRPEVDFDCSAGEVRYGVIRAHAHWTSAGRQPGTLEAALSFESTLPVRWRTRSLLLYRQGGWVVEQEPGQQ